MFMFSGNYLLFMVPAFIVVMLAQFWVNSTYKKWSQVRNRYGITGSDAAQRLINASGIQQVEVQETPGRLTDHYDPRQRLLNLSPAVAQGESIAAVAIAAHELGHAQQDMQSYFPLRFRSALVPAANIGSTFGWILMLAGLLLRGTIGDGLAVLGLGIFALGAVFALATLPVELNASTRAKAMLTQSGIISTPEEKEGVNAVLNAAAFTYVAALAAALLQVLYWGSLIMGGRRR